MEESADGAACPRSCEIGSRRAGQGSAGWELEVGAAHQAVLFKGWWHSRWLFTPQTEFAFASSDQIRAYVCALPEITGRSKESLSLSAKMIYYCQVLFAEKPSHNHYGQNETAI